MTDRITKKAKIEALLQAGKAPREIAEILGLNRRYAVDIAWRMRNPEHAKAIKRAGGQRRRADPEWHRKERERRRKRHNERFRKDRNYRAATTHSKRRWRLFKRVRAQQDGQGARS
jgi:hypothetical protein